MPVERDRTDSPIVEETTACPPQPLALLAPAWVRRSLATLLELDRSLGQGVLFARPMEPGALRTMVEQDAALHR